ncbi:HEAT repeat domain-containing protein [Dactylosporangium siamense]|uniref:HEAT repeat domain-containing protein n=1 Tax=Dactylosporangium siamense TaxID=685454 RepID=UPI001940BBDD|nr:HEAT repeat domain-containing protein [Dactylosporangium siamense]
MTPQSPAALSTPELFERALAEIRADDPEWHWDHLVALHQRPTPEVFETARALTHDSDPERRELGVRVLREVGRDDPAAAALRRDNAPVLRDLLEHEQDLTVLAWVVSAIGYNQVTEALPDLIRLAGHPDDAVRFHVAANLPVLADPDAPEDAAVAALELLTGDEDEDVRGYAIYGLVTELNVDRDRIAGTLARLLAHPDPDVRRLAAGEPS